MGLFGLFRQKGHRHDQSDLQCANDVAAIPDCKADWQIQAQLRMTRGLITSLILIMFSKRTPMA